MAVAYRNSTSNTSAGTSLVLNVPSGVQDGDIMVAVVVVSGASHAPSDHGSWGTLDTFSTSGPSIKSYYRVASSEPASYTFTTTAAVAAAGYMLAYSGGNTSAPINKHSAWTRTANSTTVTAATITPDVDGCMLLFLAGMGSTCTTFTGPTSWQQRQTPSGNGMSGMAAELLQTTKGATGAITATISINNNQGSLVAIAPAGGAPQSKDLTAVDETDVAVALVVVKTIYKSLTVATETSEAEAIVHEKTVTLTPVAETDTVVAPTFTQPHSKTLIPVAETATAVPLAKVKSKTLSVAAETDAAQFLILLKQLGISAVTETDEAQVLTFPTGGIPPKFPTHALTTASGTVGILASNGRSRSSTDSGDAHVQTSAGRTKVRV